MSKELDLEDFILLRDNLFYGMMEAAQEQVASSSIEDGSYISAALLAAHVACCQSIVSQLPQNLRKKWITEFINSAHKALSKYDKSLH